MGSVFESFLNSGFNFAILQSGGNIEYFIDTLQIWEVGLPKTVAPSFKNYHKLYKTIESLKQVSRALMDLPQHFSNQVLSYLILNLFPGHRSKIWKTSMKKARLKKIRHYVNTTKSCVKVSKKSDFFIQIWR